MFTALPDTFGLTSRSSWPGWCLSRLFFKDSHARICHYVIDGGLDRSGCKEGERQRFSDGLPNSQKEKGCCQVFITQTVAIGRRPVIPTTYKP